MRPVTILLVSLLATGCVSSSMIPEKQVVADVKRVRVVAMEAPPLSGLPERIQSASELSGAVGNAQLLGSVATARGASPVQGARVSGVASVVFIAASLAANSYCDEPQAAPSETIPLPEGIWIPTGVIAAEAQAQLTGARIDATLVPGLRPIPCVHDRRLTNLMENWLGPIRGWYNDEKPNPHYIEPQAANLSYVLEVGISNYELLSSKLLLQVMVRLIDGANGRLIGRARAHKALQMPRISLEETFYGEATPFKALIAEEGRLLVRDCLSQLGLVPIS